MIEIRTAKKHIRSVFSGVMLAVFLLAALVSGCADRPGEKESPASTFFTDDTGERIELNAPPKRIVSLSPAVTESLYLLGAQNHIVGVTTYCTRPPEAINKEKVGTVISPSIEKIVELSPDIVFAAGGLNKSSIIDSLRSLGIKVFIFGSRYSFSEICDDFRILGEIVGREDVAADIIEKSGKEVEAISERIGTLPPKKVFWQIGDKPIVTVSEGTFANELITMAGGINIASGSEMKYPRYSIEEVVKEDPDVIVIVTMGSLTDEVKHTWLAFEDMKATRTGNVFVTDANCVCAPTPVSFVEGIKRIASLFHPEEETE